MSSLFVGKYSRYRAALVTAISLILMAVGTRSALAFNPPDILNAGFESSVDRACGPVYSSDNTTCINPGTWFAAKPAVSYLNSSSECLGGNWCGVQVPQQGTRDQRVWWSWAHSAPDNSYVRAAFKFPITFEFPHLPAETNDDWKAIIWEKGSCGRNFLNFRSFSTDGKTGSVAFLSIQDQKWRYGPKVPLADGKWHSFEIFTSYAQKKVMVWMDDNLIIDATDSIGTCGTTQQGVDFGAYHNGRMPKTQTFYMDNIAISTNRIGSQHSAIVVLSPPTNLRIQQ